MMLLCIYIYMLCIYIVIFITYIYIHTLYSLYCSYTQSIPPEWNSRGCQSYHLFRDISTQIPKSSGIIPYFIGNHKVVT